MMIFKNFNKLAFLSRHNLRTYVTSSLAQNLSILSNRLNPWFVTGFTDAEGCFYVGIVKSNRVKINWEVQPEFKIELHKKDIRLLIWIQEFFNGVGKISQKGDKVGLRVRSLKEIKVIISHFEKYPLITQK